MPVQSTDSAGALAALPAVLSFFEVPVREAGDGCLLWEGDLNSQGYARVYLVGLRKRVLVHRFIYEACVGPIPKGLVIDHLCRRPACINPAHMEPVTQRENTLRGLRGRLRTPVCPHGDLYRRGDNRTCQRCASDRQRARFGRTAEACELGGSLLFGTWKRGDKVVCDFCGREMLAQCNGRGPTWRIPRHNKPSEAVG